ncbi:MAG: hypothetical protein HOV83_00885, partial [Catenulispora sp.]|nr:hypothetical protein [Catenulispora sp.]
GQDYMGTIEAYLAAPLVGLLGSTPLALRLPTLALYAAFLPLMYALAKRAYSPWLGVATVGFLAFGADRIVKNQLIAGGGYPETAPMVAALLLGVLVVAKSERPRPWLTGGLGLLTGLILWNHWLPLPYLAAAGVLLLVHRRRALWPALAGLLVGIAPLIWHDLHAKLSDRSFAIFWHLQTTGGHPPLGDRLYGGGLLGVPLGMGMCAPSSCPTWTLWWAPVYAALLVIAVVLAYRDGRSVERTMRLVLPLAALLTIASYAHSPAAAETPIESARYLSCLLISTPAWLDPLRRALGTRWALPAAAPVAAGAALGVFATVTLLLHVPVYAEMRTQQKAVLGWLADNNATRMYADYWTCDWIAYETGEQRICAVLDDHAMTRGFNRYAPYWDEVGKATDVVYLAPIGSALDGTLSTALAGVPVETVANYHVFRPGANLIRR